MVETNGNPPEGAAADEAANGPPMYDGGCRLLDWSHSARAGMTVDLMIQVPGPLGGHPFRGVPAGKEAGQRLRACVRFPVEGLQRAAVIYEGEAVLLKWSENDRTGMMVRLLLDDGPDGEQGRNPFFGLGCGRRGEPLDLLVHAVSEDELVIGPSKVRERTPFHQMNEVQQANILCRKPQFQRFLLDNVNRFVLDEAMREAVIGMADRPKDFSDAVIRAALGVTSRSVMNQDGELATRARARWRRILSLYDDESQPWRRFSGPAGG